MKTSTRKQIGKALVKGVMAGLQKAWAEKDSTDEAQRRLRLTIREDMRTTCRWADNSDDVHVREMLVDFFAKAVQARRKEKNQ